MLFREPKKDTDYPQCLTAERSQLRPVPRRSPSQYQLACSSLLKEANWTHGTDRPTTKLSLSGTENTELRINWVFLLLKPLSRNHTVDLQGTGTFLRAHCRTEGRLEHSPLSQEEKPTSRRTLVSTSPQVPTVSMGQDLCSLSAKVLILTRGHRHLPSMVF